MVLAYLAHDSRGIFAILRSSVPAELLYCQIAQNCHVPILYGILDGAGTGGFLTLYLLG